ncbi:MAG: hypothetical protein ACTSRZ_09025 [Promethearchaeota archaeon]
MSLSKLPLNNDIIKSIEFLYISNIMDEELYFWSPKNFKKSRYILDIIAIKTLTKAEDIFYQMTKSSLKICGYLKNGIIFSIGAEENIQFQLLEAVLEQISSVFFEFYGDIIQTMSGSYSDTFNGLDKFILEIFQDIKKYITITRVFCKACKKILNIYIKNSLISTTKNYPVSLVYIHEGHGLLLYIDKNYTVRGAEIVDISG